MKISLLTSLFAALGIAATTTTVTSVTYSNLGTLPHSTPLSRAWGINRGGDVVGMSYVLVDGRTHHRAFLKPAGGVMEDLGTLPGGHFSEAFDINDGGDVVGQSAVVINGNALSRAFRKRAGGAMEELGALYIFGYSVARGINNSGDVVGVSAATWQTSHAFLKRAGGVMEDLGVLPGGNRSEAWDINDAGDVVGTSSTLVDGILRNRAFLKRAGGVMEDLGVVPDGVQSYGRAINNAGDVVGVSEVVVNGVAQTRGFLKRAGEPMVSLGVPPGGNHVDAWDINDAGHITGIAEFIVDGRTRPRAFIWIEGAWYDLGPEESWHSHGFAINQHSQVAGSSPVAGRDVAALWTPTLGVGATAPKATFSASTTALTEGASFTLDLANATAGAAYAFDCGTGSYAASTTSSVSCPTPDNGTLTVKGKVTKDGLSSEYTSSVTVSNVAPTASGVTAPTSVGEGSAIEFSLTGATDPSTLDAAALQYAFDCGTDSGYGAWGTSSSASCPTTDNGTRTVKGKVRDKDGGVSPEYSSASITINNVSPTATPQAPTAPVNEGASFTFALAGGSDASSVDAASLTYAFDCGTGYGTPGSASSTSCPAIDNSLISVRGKVIDKDGGESEYSSSVTVANVPPEVVGALTAPLSPVAVNTTVTASGSFTDPGVRDTHTAQFDWNVTTPGTKTSAAAVTGSNGSGSFSGTTTYAAAGVYTVQATVTDNAAGAGASPLFQYVVVYDPSSGSVTGNGSYNSNVGDCTLNAACEAASGRTRFGFISKYVAGKSTPTGNTQFHFQAGGLKFKSTSYNALIVSGTQRAQYWGYGTVNDDGKVYSFRLTAEDNGDTGDRIRVEIWEAGNWESGQIVNGKPVYDNKAATAIQQGSIHIKK